MKTIISASRRTDVIATDYRGLLKKFEEGEVSLQNPYFPQKHYKVSLKSDDVHSVVLWSKDFTNFVRFPSILMNYSLFFQYTINNYPKPIENVRPLEYHLRNIKWLIENFGEERLTIRFDPVLFYYGDSIEEAMLEREAAFRNLLMRLHQIIDIKKVDFILSYIDLSNRIVRNMKHSNIALMEASEHDLTLFFSKIKSIANDYDVNLFSCADDRLVKAGIDIKGCIDGHKIEQVTGVRASKAKDGAQRKRCPCTKSVDIGVYPFLEHGKKCALQCKYCYVKGQLIDE